MCGGLPSSRTDNPCTVVYVDGPVWYCWNTRHLQYSRRGFAEESGCKKKREHPNCPYTNPKCRRVDHWCSLLKLPQALKFSVQ